MTTEKELKDEGRLTSLEIHQKASEKDFMEMKDDVAQIKKDVTELKQTIAKAGGIIIGFSMIGAFFGFMISQLDKLKHFFVGN